MFGRTLRIEPATGTKREPGTFRRNFIGNDDGRRPPRREFRDRSGQGFGGGFREFSTLRAGLGGMTRGMRPVQLMQVNALLGRRMFGLAASAVLRRRFA